MPMETKQLCAICQSTLSQTTIMNEVGLAPLLEPNVLESLLVAQSARANEISERLFFG